MILPGGAPAAGRFGFVTNKLLSMPIEQFTTALIRTHD